MSGNVAIERGGDTPAVRRSWLPRTVAAVFLGAGLYAGLAIAGDAVAHAADPTPSTTPAQQTPASQPAGTAPAATDQTATPAEKPANGTSTVTSSSTTGTATTSSTTTTTTSSSQTAGTTTGTPSSATSGSSTTAPATTTSTTPTAPTGGAATSAPSPTAAAVSTPAPVAAAATPAPAPVAADAPAPLAPTSTVAARPTGIGCKPAGLSAEKTAGSATRNRTVAATPDSEPSATALPAEAAVQPTEAPAADQTTVSGGAPAGTPLAPQDPQQLPSPTVATAFSSCGGPGAGQSSPKGASAPTTAGVLVLVADIPVDETGTAPAAPVAGSPATSANDPATRPA